MKFSIITPVRNSVKYIEETIKSVINQEKIDIYSEIEYIIVDGLSTDGTLEIIKDYQSKFSFIKLVSEKDDSMYEALTKGLKLCTGEIVSYVNAGDIYNINAFNIIKNIFLYNKNISWLTGGKYIYNENSETTQTTMPYKYRPQLIQAGVYGKYLPFIQQESTFWRVELHNLIKFEQLKNFKLAGDYFLWLNFSKKFELYIIQTHLGGFKIHQGQLSSKTIGSNLTYKKEMQLFTKKIGIKEIFLIILDVIPWTVLRYSHVIFGNFANHLMYDHKSQSYTGKIEHKNDKIYCWACDIGTNRGEGRLAQKFLSREFNKNTSFSIKTLTTRIEVKHTNLDTQLPTEKKINLNFAESYISPIIGVLWLWIKYLSGKKTCYINFVPLWNTFLILFLPPKTHLGPITGSVYNGKVFGFKSFLRKYFIPILYKINSSLILYRNKKLIFSTNLLKKYFIDKDNLNLKFNYLISDIVLKNYNSSKKIDLSIYFRHYDTKNNYFFEKIIEHFTNQNKYKFVYFGHQHKNFVKNFKGHIENKKVDIILNDTKFSIISEENLQSLYSLECLSNHVNIFYDSSKMNKSDIIKDSKKVIDIDYNNAELAIKNIENHIENYDKINIPYKIEDINY